MGQKPYIGSRHFLDAVRKPSTTRDTSPAVQGGTAARPSHVWCVACARYADSGCGHPCGPDCCPHRQAAAQVRAGQDGEAKPTAAEIAREQDAYRKGYEAAKWLCSDLAALARTTAAEEANERLRSALRDIDRWSQAYPLKVFPEVDDAYLTKAHAALQQHGMGVDRISASAMRHVVEGVGEIARRALASAEGGRDDGR